MSQDSLLGGLPMESLEDYLQNSPMAREMVDQMLKGSQEETQCCIETRENVQWMVQDGEGRKASGTIGLSGTLNVEKCEINVQDCEVHDNIDHSNGYHPYTEMQDYYSVPEVNNGPIVPLGSIVPTTTNWPGTYNFKLSFEQQPEKTTKSASWTYSEVLDKLFLVHRKACPVKFEVDTNVPPGCFIRALPLFTKAEHLQEPVRRCPNHSAASDVSNIGHCAPDHLMRCDARSATYQTCPNGRLSVVVPYEAPQAGSQHTTYLYEFMCYNSCVGGLNRRPLQVIFTLEKDGQVIGRRKLPVRICACPGRDRRNEEKARDKYLGNRSLSRQSSMTKSVTSEVVVAGPSSKKRKLQENEYILKVNKLEHFEILKKIKESLELADLVTPDVLTNYHAKSSTGDAARALASMGIGSPRKTLKKKPRVS